jgi:hypothetical protein
VNNSLGAKETNEYALDFVLHLSRLFWSRCVWTFRVRLVLSSANACIITARVSVALSRDSHKIRCSSVVGSIAKSHQSRYTTPDKST